MIAAEQWHRYQEDYIKYGIDLAPERKKPERKKAEKSALRVSVYERTLILITILAIGICCVAMIFFQACASDINYSVYTLNKEISNLEGDIDNLTVELNGYNNLDDIEYVATTSLNMVYPDNSQYITVNSTAQQSQIDAYIASLTKAEKGIVVQKNATVASAARHLLANA
ncbi:MAG: cell division protein FtsL [Firmicutes bacterium]|nr:cell division protein FtsL [Bacillota bacterium]